MKRLLAILIMLLPYAASAQQYTGMSGLIHTPSADMDAEGVARVGGHFLNKAFTPDGTFDYDNEKYNTGSFYMSITPFKWVEVGYTFTLRKRNQNYFGESTGNVGYYGKDRYVSVKFRLLTEKKWWPSIALGSNDPVTTASEGNAPFRNYYVAATKHFDLGGHQIGMHAAYRYWYRSYNDKWNGIVGGITYSPPFDHNRCRLIAEWTGTDVNLGMDYLLFGYALLQASLQEGKYISGGLCLYLNLL